MSNQKSNSKHKRVLTGISIDDVAVPKWGDTGAPRRDQFNSDKEFKEATDKHRVESRIQGFLESARMPEPIDSKRILKLRFSGLPFCALRWFIKLPSNLCKQRQVDFGYRYFTKVGHTVHDVFQSTVEQASGLTFLKDFICAEPTCRTRYAMRTNSPSSCDKCGSSAFDSDEHEIIWRGAVGHVDEIIARDEDHKTVDLWDYKTTSTRSLNKADSIEYVSQIRSYATVLSERGYKVESLSLIYIPRDNPYGFRVSMVPWDEKIRINHLKWMEFWLDEHAKGMRVATLEEARVLLADRPCTPDSRPRCYSKCEFKDFCTTEAQPAEVWKRVETSFLSVKQWLPLNKRQPSS